MDLKDAAKLAARFAGRNPPFDQILLGDDMLSATDGYRGVEVTAPLQVGTVSVTAADLVKAVTAAGAGATVSTKGKSLIVAGPDHKFTLRLRTDKVPRDELNCPAGTPVAPATMAAVLAAASLARDNLVQPQLSGLRFTPNWVGGCTQAAAWVVWASVTDKPITVDPTALALVSPSELAVTDRDLLLYGDDAVAWSRGLDTVYPDASVEQLISNSRKREAHSIIKLDVAALIGLCAVAAKAQVSPADLLGLQVAGPRVRLYRGPVDDHPEYEGDVECGEVFASHDLAPVGVSPALLKDALGLCRGEGDHYLAVGGPSLPVVLWGGDPPVEVILAPGFLRASS
jgi:hypothetical protein